MKSFAQTLAEDRRLCLLKLLEQAPGYEANGYLLQAALPQFGHESSLDAVKGDLAWLAEQQLVSVKELGGVTIATLTQRGADVADGRAVVPGVKKPRPE